MFFKSAYFNFAQYNSQIHKNVPCILFRHQTKACDWLTLKHSLLSEQRKVSEKIWRRTISDAPLLVLHKETDNVLHLYQMEYKLCIWRNDNAKSSNNHTNENIYQRKRTRFAEFWLNRLTNIYLYSRIRLLITGSNVPCVWRQHSGHLIRDGYVQVKVSAALLPGNIPQTSF